LDYLCLVGRPCQTYYLWRPTLRDPDDDMVLEVAVAAGCEYIVTHNVRDFAEAKSFGVGVTTPREFLRRIGVIR
jgi:predicted nucleic acid-binding protein